MSEIIRERAAPPPGWHGFIERICETLTVAALSAMVIIIVVDIVTRNLLGISLQISDEVCGYMLVAATFLAIPVSLANDGFHKMAILEGRLSHQAGLVLRIFTEILSLIVCLLIEWQLIRYVLQSYRSDSIATTDLRTPLWIPQAIMPIGFALLCIILASKIISMLAQLRTGEPVSSPAE